MCVLYEVVDRVLRTHMYDPRYTPKPSPSRVNSLVSLHVVVFPAIKCHLLYRMVMSDH